MNSKCLKRKHVNSYERSHFSFKAEISEVLCSLSIIQQIQFHVTIGHAGYSLYTGCPFPCWMQWALIGYAVTFIILFANFYYHAYRRKPSSLKGGKPVTNGTCNVANGHRNMEEVEENGKRQNKGRAKREWIRKKSFSGKTKQINVREWGRE